MENKETGKPEEKVLRQEEFRVDCPRKIVVGDPLYFEEYSGERLRRLTAYYAPPRYFEARVILTETEFADFPGEKVCGLSIYMAPKETRGKGHAASRQHCRKSGVRGDVGIHPAVDCDAA